MKLDLICNSESIGVNKNPNDECYTPDYAISPILPYIRSGSTVWCPFDGENSRFVNMLRSSGHRVIHSHIESGGDFFTMKAPDNVDYIISNPPYSIKYEVFKRLFEIGLPFAMLVGVVGLFESKKRFELFNSNNFEIMYFDKRIAYFKDYSDPKPNLHPPFSSVYLCSKMLPDRIVFATISK